MEGVENLDEALDGLVLGEFLLVLEVGTQVTLVAVLEDEVDVVGGLLDVEELDDVVVPAGLQHFDFVLEELRELA